MWLIFAVLTVILWGVSETIFKKSSKTDKNSVAHLLAYNGIIYGITAIIYMLIVYKGFHFNVMNILKYSPIAAIYTLAMFSYYHAMSRIKISIVSPIVNSSCIITVLLSVVILKQYPNLMQLIAIVLIIFSIIMLSIEKDESDVEKEKVGKNTAKIVYIIGIVFALGYFFFDGIASFLDEYLLDELGMIESDIIISYAINYMIVGIICYIYLKVKDKNYKFQMDKLKLTGGVIEAAGEYTFIYALASGDAAIISPFVAAYSVVTIILSRIFLKEKLKLKKYILVTTILVGIIMLSL